MARGDEQVSMATWGTRSPCRSVVKLLPGLAAPCADPRRRRGGVRRSAPRRRARAGAPAVGLRRERRPLHARPGDAFHAALDPSRRGARAGARAADGISWPQSLRRGAEPRERASGDRRRVRHRRSSRARRAGQARGSGCSGSTSAAGSTGSRASSSRTSSSMRRLPRASSLPRSPPSPGSIGGSPRSSACRRATIFRLLDLPGAQTRSAGDRGARVPPLLHELRRRALARRRPGRGDA